MHGISRLLSSFLVFAIWSCEGNKTSTDSAATTPTTPAPAIPTGSTPAATTPAAPTFTELQSSIFNVYCTGCHNGTDGMTNFSKYSGVAAQVTAGDASNSALYTMVSSGQMPQGGPTLPSNLVSQVQAWINAGAKND